MSGLQKAHQLGPAELSQIHEKPNRKFRVQMQKKELHTEEDQLIKQQQQQPVLKSLAVISTYGR